MKPLQEKAYEILFDKILKEELERGVVYSEAKIAEDLGMSRTPVRSALQRLSQDRYIDILPSRGFRLHELTEKDVEDTFELRTAMEGYSAMMIAREYNTDKGREVIKKLKKNIELQRNIVESDGEIEDFIDVDMDFHMTILDYTKNQWFMDNFKSAINLIKVLARTSLKHQGRMAVGFKEHEDVYLAMLNGNVNEIFDLIERCMENPKSINLSDLNNKKVL